LYQLERGRKLGDGRILKRMQEEALQRAMQDHFPEDYQIDSALWTRRAVQALIEQLCGVKMPIRTVGEYLRRWGYTPKRPVERAYEQDPKAVQQWLNHEYPQIEQRAQTEGAEVAWGDESGVSSTEYGLRACLKRGAVRIGTLIRANLGACRT
jgi:transposase